MKQTIINNFSHASQLKRHGYLALIRMEKKQKIVMLIY